MGKHARDRLRWWPSLLALALGTGVAEAHHSFAAHFKGDELVTVTGSVTGFRLTNPHGLVFLTVEEDGEAVEWKAETNSPSILRRRGWTPDSLKPGDRVTIEGYRARDGSNYLRIAYVVFPDGRRLEGQRPEAQADVAAGKD
jgi:hypothetical protein